MVRGFVVDQLHGRILVFSGFFFNLFIHPIQLLWNDGRNTVGVVVVIVQESIAMPFPSSGVSFTFLHKLLDQLNVLFEAAANRGGGIFLRNWRGNFESPTTATGALQSQRWDRR